MKQVGICRNCDLHKNRIKRVEEKGPSRADLIFIQMSPSVAEDALGKPFVSDANRMLEQIIKRAGILLGECYFTYMVLCRACDKVNGITREPTEEEIRACMPNVLHILEHVICRGVVFLDKRIETIYRKKIQVPYLTITNPKIIKIKGGTQSALFTDATMKLERFYDHITGKDV